MATSKEIKDGYTSTLQDLTCNSKPLISVLTMLAEENVAHAKDIVEAIEAHLAKVRTEVKLPVLYLIDCIIKNVGGPYTSAFCNNIVPLFCNVFKVVDEKTRTEMYKLRQTWNEVLPKSKLYTLDVQTNQIDPAWPITAAPPNIHFNPKFLKSSTTINKKEPISISTKPTIASLVPGVADPATLDMQQKLIIKQKELLELQQKKLELELLQTQVKLQEQLKKSHTNSEDLAKLTTGTKNVLLKPEVAKQLLEDSGDIVKSKATSMNTRPHSTTNMGSNLPKIAPVNSALLAATRPIRDPRLLRQQAAQQNTVNSNVQLENKSNTTNTLNNKVVNIKMSSRNERNDARFVNNKDEIPKSKILSRIPLKSKRSISPSNKSSKTNRSSKSSSGSGSTSSLDSPTKSKSSRSSSKSPSKYKKNVSSSNSLARNEIKKSGKSSKNDRKSPTKDSGFKDVKGLTKNRNYMRRNRDASLSPEPELINHDVDLRVAVPSEKQPRLQGDSKEDKCDVSIQGMDLNSKHPSNVSGKKRSSTDGNDVQPTKKSKSEMFDVLFGNEDVDLRQMSVITSPKDIDKPPTPPPPPIISNKPKISEKENSTTNGSPERDSQKTNLDVLRAKLANATNKDKLNNTRINLIAEQKKNGGAPPTWRGGRGGGFPGPRGPIRPPRPGIEPWIRPHNPNPPHWRPPFNKNAFEESKIVTKIIDTRSNSPIINSNEPPTDLVVNCSNQDDIKSINIDGEPRDIIFYDETAIAFMTWEDPREISFQNGSRRVTFDDKETYTFAFNEPYRDVMINNHLHKVRLGAPTREIHIDGKSYECFFGGPGIAIDLNGKLTVVKIEGPPPQVKIGLQRRTDIVAGKISLIIDAKTIIPVYLDSRTQKFDVEGKTHTIRFTDALQTVMINDAPFKVEFGGLPKPITLNDKKHFVRFSVLPRSIKPGRVNIKGMEQTFETIITSDNENSQDAFETQKKKSRFSDDSPDSPNSIQNLLQHSNFGNLDSLLSNVLAATASLPPSSQTTGGYLIDYTNDQETNSEQKPATFVPPPPLQSSININDLFQKLVTTGIVTSTIPEHPVESVTGISEEQQEPILESSTIKIKRPDLQIKPVDFAKASSLKVRQPALIHALYSGMQCSSCGMRFPPENSMLYSQHLDWHFRQNRKGKKNIRKATSRRWYYSITDWNNYEEIEDLEEREKCYFETQPKEQVEGANEEGDEEIEIPSVPADSNITDPCCEVCQEKFEQFYNEEKEEWHLRMAIRIDDRTYHPLCYDDYKASLISSSFEDSLVVQNKDVDKDENSIPGLELPLEEKSDSQSIQIIIDDVESIESNANTPKPEEKDEGDNTDAVAPYEDEDDDVIINEVQPERIILDEYEFKRNVDEDLVSSAVIKTEPIDDGFMDVENFKLGEVKIKSEPITPDETFEDIGQVIPESEIPKDIPIPSDTTHAELVTTIDGNVELNSGAAPPASGISGKIKINISKQLPVIAPKENKDISLDVDNTIEPIDPTQPLPPGEEPVQLHLKPALQSIELKKLPPVNKGSELTGLCSIM